MAPRNRHRSRSRRGALVALFGAAGILLAAGVIGIVMTVSAPATGPVDMNGNRVVLDPGTQPSTRVQQEMHAVAATGPRFAVPSVGLNVPLGALSEVGGTIVPPGFTSAYLVRNLGVPLDDAAHGTVFVVMHSVRGGGVGPGNYLIDVDTGRSKVSIGATIEVGSLRYQVTDSQAIPKTQVPHDTALWADTPGRLVVVTCLQVPAQTASVDNMVLTAQLDQ